MQALILKQLTLMSTRMACYGSSHDSQLGFRYSSQAKIVIEYKTIR